MSDETNLIAAFIAGVIGGFLFCYAITVIPMKADAVKHGVAEWRVIPDSNGSTEFKWKDAK
jgi:hypothetical protein